MFRTVRPSNGYCLFFPSRRSGQRFVAGRKVRVWLWEEWKHVKLGQFAVIIPGDGEPELFTTSEGLECNVRADFKAVVGGSEKGRETRLEAATISCPATRDHGATVELDFFRDWASRYCSNSIKRILSQCSYVRLIEDPEYRAESIAQIRQDLRANLEGIGILLVEDTVLIEPLEPKGVLATKDVLDRWLAFRETVDAATLARKNADLEQQKSTEDLDRSYELWSTQEGHKKKVKEEEQRRDKEEAISKITAVMDQWNQEAQLRKIQLDHQLDEERDRLENELKEQRLQAEDELLKKRIEIQKHEQEKERQEAERVKIMREADLVKIEIEEARGAARARVAEQECLAREAGSVKRTEAIMQSLPKILEEAGRSFAKIGEIRAIHLGGSPEGGSQGSLGAFLTSATALPIVREMLRFVQDLESDSNRTSTPELRSDAKDDETSPE